jgi:beta-mannosidase
MESAFAEWRRADDPCGGALTWFLNDLRPGAGWGVIDSDGTPKAVYYHLRRAWAPRCVRLLDRGLDGLSALVVNESEEPLVAQLELRAFARGGTTIEATGSDVRLAPRTAVEVPVEEAFGHFVDSTYSYRFGPPRHEAVVARMICGDIVVSEHVYRPVPSTMTLASGLDARATCAVDGTLNVLLTSETILYGVRIEVRDHRSLENHLCLTPGRTRSVPLRRTSDSGRSFQGHVDALNLTEPVRLADPY